MNLVRLVYASRFSSKTNVEALQAIVKASRRNNPKKGLTGVLCYAPGLFLQCLEGPRAAVNEMYHRIMNDPRNKAVTLLAYADIDERLFEEWDMAYLRANDLTATVIMKYNAGTAFDPYSMNGAQALGFLRCLLHKKDQFQQGTAKVGRAG